MRAERRIIGHLRDQMDVEMANVHISDCQDINLLDILGLVNLMCKPSN